MTATPGTVCPVKYGPHVCNPDASARIHRSESTPGIEEFHA